MKASQPWHILLVALYPVLFLYTENLTYVSIKEVLPAVGYILLATISVYFLFKLLFKDKLKAGLMTSTLLLLFFSYGHYYELLFPQRIPVINVRFDHNFYKWSSLIIILLITWRLFKLKAPKKLNSLANFMALLLIAMPLFKLFAAGDNKLETQENKPEDTKEHEFERSPSVYYLIMDAYGRDDVFEEMYDFDNSYFTDYLREKGFYVADKSVANYNKTVLSVPAALSMNYLDSLAEVMGEDSKDQRPLLDLINENPVVDHLKSGGYSTFSFDAPILDYLFMDSADLFYRTPDAYVNLFENKLVKLSVISAFKRTSEKTDVDLWERHRKKILMAFEKLEDISKHQEPFYIHGHILSPHQPFVFDKDGNAVNPSHHYSCWHPVEDGRKPEEYRREYVEQLQFVNSKLMETVDAILANSEEAPIIIIQGDHGPCAELTNTKAIEGNNFKERMPILNAIYFPDGSYEELYPEISPVNNFRVVMNRYFGMDLDLLPDSAYYSTWDRNYDFVNVTEAVNTP